MRAAAIGLIVFLVLALALYASGGRVHWPENGRTAGQESLAEAVADAMSAEDPLVRTAGLATALQGFGPEALGEVEEAWTTIDGHTGGSKTVGLVLLVDWWSRHEPEEVFNWLNQRYRNRDSILMATLVRSWATQSPIAASRAVASLPRSRLDQDISRLFNAVVIGWNASGDPGVEEFLLALRSDVDRQGALTALANDKVRRDGIEAAIRWAEALPDTAAGDFKQLAFRRVASAIARIDPLRAAAWAETQLGGEWGSGLPRRVAQRWAREDGQAAMEWLRGLPDSPDLSGAFEEAYRAWLGSDREAARAWLREQELDASLDPVVGIYARSLARDDPEAALPWAARMQHETRRDETLEKIARVWMLRDPEAARAWIETSDLSENARARVYAANEKAQQQSRRRPATPR